MRGIAAVAVVAFHIHGGGYVLQSSLARNAWLAVDFFFVLSGFVIAASYGARLAAGFPVRRYMLLRLGRVYPLHLATLALYLLSEGGRYFGGVSAGTPRVPFVGSRSVGTLGLTALLVNGFWPTGAQWWNGQSWSISIEVWLYLAMAGIWRLAGRKAATVAMALALVAMAALGIADALPQPPFSSFLLRGMGGFGVGVACWHLRERRLIPRPMRAATGLEIAAAAIALAAIAWPHPGVWRTAGTDLAFAVVVWVFAEQRGALSRVLTKAPFVFLGTISYSIYMTHQFVAHRFIDGLRLVGLGTMVLGEGDPDRRIMARR